MTDMKQALLLYGAMWCPDTVRSRRFLDEHGVAYEWFDIKTDPEAKEFVRRTNKGKVVIPTIVFPDGSILVEPSDDELARKVLASYAAS
jgi:glutaredoxin